jgi:hypothetical protein
MAARWLLTPQDVEAIVGPIGAAAWGQHVSPLEPIQVAREYDYRIESGSARKPNKATRQEQMQAALQNLGPVLSNLIGAGVVEPFNALIKDWAESLDLDATPYLVPPPPPPPEPPPGMGGPTPEPGGGNAPPEPAPEQPPQVPQELSP